VLDLVFLSYFSGYAFSSLSNQKGYLDPLPKVFGQIYLRLLSLKFGLKQRKINYRSQPFPFVEKKKIKASFYIYLYKLLIELLLVALFFPL